MFLSNSSHKLKTCVFSLTGHIKYLNIFDYNDDITYQKILDSVKLLIKNRRMMFLRDPINSFLEKYYSILRRIGHGLTLDNIDELFEDHEYE